MIAWYFLYYLVAFFFFFLPVPFPIFYRLAMVDSPTMKKTFVVPDIKPLDLYDCTKAKICASVGWLLAKSYGSAGRLWWRLQAWGVRIMFREVVWRPPTFSRPAVCLYSVQQCSEKHMHVGELQCVYSSAVFSTKRRIWKGDHARYAFFDTCHLFSLNVRSHFLGMCVSERQASSLGLIALTHFVVFSSRQASDTNCRLLDMFLIRLHRHGTWGVDGFLNHSSPLVMTALP